MRPPGCSSLLEGFNRSSLTSRRQSTRAGNNAFGAFAAKPIPIRYMFCSTIDAAGSDLATLSPRRFEHASREPSRGSNITSGKSSMEGSRLWV